ncbi:MAG: hypothetical protein J6A83_03120 [Clostridia bacterium]|nr:hypothetical protein [Clostridia bacterium]
MKRLISFLIVAVMIFQCFSVLVSATDFSVFDIDEKELANSGENIGDIHNCIYLPEEEKVRVSGTVNHEVMVTHNDYKIALFAVPEGETLYDIVTAPEAEPLASADISIKFEFEVDAKTNTERFSRYAVVIYNDSGDLKLIDEPKHANVETSYTYDAEDKTAYKGVGTSLVSSATDSGVGTAIIPVYLEKLLGSSSTGYLYAIQGSYIYFDKAYVGELDASVKSLAATGSRVYLQFLISADAESGIAVLNVPDTEKYALPDMSAEQSVNLIVAFTDFICDRYETRNDSHISGIILGSSVDTGYSAELGDIESYADNYAHYMMVAGTVARAITPSIDIVIPLSDKNTYGAEDYSAVVSKPSELLENICKFFDKCFSDGFSFSSMIETSSIPYGINEETILNKKGFSPESNEEIINADNAKLYSAYLDTLRAKYDSSPQSFIFVWSVPTNISGNVLSCAYAYSYFKLMSNERISSFVVSFAQSEKEGIYIGYSKISNIIKYIDTADSFAITAPQLDMLGASNWYAVIDDMYSGRLDIRRILELEKLDTMPENIIGNYSYYDFSYYTAVSEWFGGSLCDSLKIDYSDISGRSLQAHFLGKTQNPTDFAEIYCNYEYPENFVYTPYMSLNFSIENDDNDKGALYEIRIAFGSGKNSAEITELCRAYEQKTVLFDISDFCEVSMADYIKIGVRCLSGEESGYKLCFASMEGYSSEYISEELETLISEERLRIRNMLQVDKSDGEKEENTFLVVAVVAVVIAVIGVGIFMCFKREEEEEQKE